MLEILVDINTSNSDLRCCFLQAQVHHQPHCHSRGQSDRGGGGTCPSARQSNAPPHASINYTSSQRPTNVFQQSAANYNAEPTTHVIPNDPPRVLVETNPPSSPSTPPRVDCPSATPQLSPTCSTHNSVQAPRVVPPVAPTQLNFGDSPITRRHPQPRPNVHTASPPREPPQIFPRLTRTHAPAGPPHQLRHSYHIAAKQRTTDDAPSRNTQSCTQFRTLMQETLLSCVHVHNFVMGRAFTARHAAQRTFPLFSMLSWTPKQAH
jgi:hypothetical protein